MRDNHVQTLVVGAGVVGLAIARKLAGLGQDVLVLEAEESGYHHTSARNSQVMHTGLLNQPGSLKADLCALGQRMMYDFCRTRHVDHSQCGKLVIAQDDQQMQALVSLKEKGEQTGVQGLHLLTGEQATALEPELACHAALLSPSTGIVDAPAFMLALEGEAQANGALFAYHAPVLSAEIAEDGFLLEVGGEHGMHLHCQTLINAAGLGAWDVARPLSGSGLSPLPHQSFVKACYFALRTGKSPFERLIYPLPNPDSPSVHALKDLSGLARIGPSQSFLTPAVIDYSHDSASEPFEAALRAFWPAMPDKCLLPDTCGIRPRITVPGEPLADFNILGPADHKKPGLVHLFGIESPGLTASLALADHVACLI